MRGTPVQRFAAKVRVIPCGGCWEWTGGPAQRLAVLTALVALGDATAWQIVDRLNGPESGTVRSRLAQMHRAGYAEKVGALVERRGAGNTVWRATAEGRRVVAAIGGPS